MDEDVTLDDLIGHLDDEEEDTASGPLPSNSRTASFRQIESTGATQQRPRQPLLPISSSAFNAKRQESIAKGAQVAKRPRKIGGFSHLVPVNRSEDLTQGKVLGLWVKDECLPADDVFTTVFEDGNRLYCPLAQLKGAQPYQLEDLADFATVCVVASRGATKVSHSTGLPFRIWTLTDLKDVDLSLFIFGEAYKTYTSAILEGDVLAIVRPKLNFETSDDGVRELRVSVSTKAQIVKLGVSPIFAKCKDVNCVRAADRSVSVYCKRHAAEQLMLVASNRMNLNSSGGACFAVNPHNHNKLDETKPRNKGKPLPNRVPLAAASSLIEAMGTTPKLEDANKTFVEQVIAKKVPETMTAGQLKLAQALKLANSTGASSSRGKVSIPLLPPSSSRTSGSSSSVVKTHLGRPTSNSSSGSMNKNRLGSGLASTSESLRKPAVNIVFGAGALSNGERDPSVPQPKASTKNQPFHVPDYGSMIKPSDRVMAASKGFRKAFAAIKPEDDH